MKILDSVKTAFMSLFANKLRSSLTMLGVIIGVGSVITLMAVGQGAQNLITSQISELGSNVLFVQPRNPDAPGFAGTAPGFTVPSLTLADAEAIAKIPGVLGVAPTNENFVKVTSGNEEATVVLEGTTPLYLEISNFKMATGQFIQDKDVNSRSSVIVLGSKPAGTLFGNADPIGQVIKIKDRHFTVIGVLAPKGGSLFGLSNDDIAMMPITAFQTRLYSSKTASGEEAVAAIAIKLTDRSFIDPVQTQVTELLRKEHHLTAREGDDFAVVSQEQLLGIFNQITGVFTIFLGSIASISLLVGGIGIMNIMLVSVTERTREIGIRKAVGAKRRDILMQFLFEAATLSVTGGIIGVLGGSLIAFGISQINFGGTIINAVVSPMIVLLALTVSVVIGLVSGIYPAMRAASLNPIDALHYG